jgi:hypothetical protein
MRVPKPSKPDELGRYFYVAVWFVASNGKKGMVETWTNRFQTKFFWQALGKQGEEESGFLAAEAARNWIRDGVASLKRSAPTPDDDNSVRDYTQED